MCLAEQVLVSERRLISKPHTAELDQGAQHTPVVVVVVRGQEVDVLGRADEAVGNDANPPITTKRASSAAIAATATSSSGSSVSIGSLDGAHQPRRLSREVLSTSQQLTNRRVGWRCQCAALFLVERGPLGLVAGLEQGPGARIHGPILPHLGI